MRGVVIAEELVSMPAQDGVGLPRWWIGSVAVASSDGLTLFGVDTQGKASACCKRFGGGGGFGEIWGRERPIADSDFVVRLAERVLQ
jgi:hypothetical protein